MVAEGLGLLFALGACATFTMMNWGRLPRAARIGLNGTAFGLLTTSRYVEVDHALHAILFAVGAAAVMAIAVHGLLAEREPLL